jgi:hypothetical protein
MPGKTFLSKKYEVSEQFSMGLSGLRNKKLRLFYKLPSTVDYGLLGCDAVWSCNHLQDYTELQPRRQHSTSSPQWEHRISPIILLQLLQIRPCDLWFQD